MKALESAIDNGDAAYPSIERGLRGVSASALLWMRPDPLLVIRNDFNPVNIHMKSMGEINDKEHDKHNRNENFAKFLKTVASQTQRLIESVMEIDAASARDRISPAELNLWYVILLLIQTNMRG